jgi:hypothetical protein
MNADTSITWHALAALQEHSFAVYNETFDTREEAYEDLLRFVTHYRGGLTHAQSLELWETGYLPAGSVPRKLDATTHAIIHEGCRDLLLSISPDSDIRMTHALGVPSRLILAAPDLLAACEKASMQSHHPACPGRKNAGNGCTCFVGMAIAAIAKAKGEN